MIRHSQNGYTSYDRSVITTYTVTKTGRKMNLRVGPTGEMLADAIRWFDENIRDIDPGILDEWGYAERPIRGDDGSDPDNDSNHASGTAADIDATKWPLGVEPTRYLTLAEIARLNAKLAEYEGCIRWGANYSGRKDPMHLEINRDEVTVGRTWAKIKARRGLLASGGDYRVVATQLALNFQGSEIDGLWGEQTERGVNTVRNAINGGFPYGVVEAQTRVGAVADGDWGSASREALLDTVAELQRAWEGLVADGQWGSATQARYETVRRAFYRG